MSLPLLSIAALGGTVSMQAARPNGGVMPSLDGQTLLSQVPQLNASARVIVETLCLQASASLDFERLLDVLAWAREQVAQGASGVLITQGTDTLEESAFFLDLLWPFDTPLVLTGAMRPSSQLGADGPANLLQAGLVALAAESRKRGVQVVLNGQVHAAARVRKIDALALEAFSSPLFGPAGLIIENNVRYLHPPAERRTLPLPQRLDQRVAMLEATLSADTLLLEQLPGLGYEGLVIAGFGAGHVSEHWANIAAGLARHIPVVVATRTGAGPTATKSYGFIGSEMDLLKRGVQMAGALCPRKTRILLWLLLGCQCMEELPDWLGHFDL
ncbi:MULTISPECIES: asparaginase [Pseudomonas]|uniref:L-asparaginase/GlutRNAGln amidotransferase subunit D n=1 Tax=Pseudomonas asplenii TaxID=53407 RepID=A0A0M9GDD0_9PSED|nr:asparaginase [Pseudomonas fuscovaginae]KPA88324.1 L-asparaginase/GlutRNAGln amidotransferase subunit D [Pseudomonas fuscovaginae]KPA95720.1 L-asparaginase/GlutRNAGln amidotransferase subunit D [Pseudomonas fuscovaginae]